MILQWLVYWMSEQPQGRTADPRIEKLQRDLVAVGLIFANAPRQALVSFGIDSPTYSIFITCYHQGSITIRELARILPVERARISRLLSRMEDRGLIRKTRLSDDQRVVRVDVTEEGLALAPEMLERMHEYYLNLLYGMEEEEVSECMAIASKMIAGAEGDGAPAGSGGDDGESPQAGNATSSEDGIGEWERQINNMQECMIGLLNLIYRGILERLMPWGLNPSEFCTIDVCEQAGLVPLATLQQMMPLETQQLRRMVSDLTDRNLLEKVRLRDDRRVVRVKVTEQARAMLPDLRHQVNEHYAYVMSSVSDEEVARLMAFVDRLVTNAAGPRPAIAAE